MNSTKRICAVSHCQKKHFGLGFCSGHYRRFKLYGDPLGGKRAERGIPTKWLYQNSSLECDNCLDWPFGMGDRGYGQVTLDRKPMKASRAMCIIAHGPAPSKNHQAAHSCGNPLCVNPRHLRWATPKQNTRDKYDHGTMLCGEDVSSAKLTASQVIEIRSRAGSLPQRVLAERYGVSQPAISAVIHRRTWGHLS